MNFADGVQVRQLQRNVTVDFTYGAGEDRTWVAVVEIPNEVADELELALLNARHERAAHEARARSEANRAS